MGKKINDDVLDELLKGCERPEDLLQEHCSDGIRDVAINPCLRPALQSCHAMPRLSDCGQQVRSTAATAWLRARLEPLNSLMNMSALDAKSVFPLGQYRLRLLHPALVFELAVRVTLQSQLCSLRVSGWSTWR